MAGTSDTTDDAVFTYRVATFEEMGFDNAQAQLLASATELSRYTDRHGKAQANYWPLAISNVQKALDKGCDHATAMMIFAA